MKYSIIAKFFMFVLVLSLAATTLWAAADAEEPTAAAEKKYVTDPATGELVEKPRYGGTMTYSVGLDPGNLDPWHGSLAVMFAGFWMDKLGAADWAIDRDVFSFKTSFFPFEIYRPHVAESWDVISPTELHIKIREDVYWQDRPPMYGRQLTAKDVEWAYHRALGLGSGMTEPTPYAAQMTSLPWESVTAVDEFNLVVKLYRPDLIAWGMFVADSYEAAWLYPREVVEMYGDTNDWENAVGSGPFIFADYVKGSSYTFTKNPNYFKDDEKYPDLRLPYVDKVKVLIIEEKSTSIAALRTGKTDHLGGLGLSFEEAAVLRRTNPELVDDLIEDVAPMIAMKMDGTHPYDDIRVRKAMQKAINMEEIAATYYGGYADPSPSGHFGKQTIGYYLPFEDWPADVQEDYKYDPAAARQLLADAGYPDGFTTILDVSAGLERGDVDLSQILKAQWAEIGVTVEINQMEAAPFFARIQSRGMNGLNFSFSGVNYCPMCWLKIRAYSEAAQNPHAVSDPVFDAMADAAGAATTWEDQKRLAREADMYSIRQMWHVTLPWLPLFTFYQPWLKGYLGEKQMGGGSGAQWARVWVDQDLKYELTGTRD